MSFNPVDPSTGEITTYGLVNPDADTLLLQLNEELLVNLKASGIDTNIDTSDKSVVGRLNGAFANHLANIWAKAKDIESSMYVQKATGTSLAKLALLVGFLRNPATATTGELRFVGEDGATIPANTTYSSTRGDYFVNPLTFDISLTRSLSFQITVGVLGDARTYSVTIDSKNYTVTSPQNPTYHSLLTLLSTELEKDSSITATLSPDLEEDSYIFVEKIDQTVPMNVTVSALLTPNSVEVEQNVIASETGVVFGDAGTINNIVTPITGLDSVRNLTDFITGTNTESDEELRKRISSDFNSVGSGTLSTIEVALRKEPDVASVSIEENRTFTTNTNGVPAKSYETIIHHLGDDTKIAQKIWETKPTGIETYGTKTVQVIDAGGVTQDVHYTLATELFAHIRVRYTRLQDEGEDFPSGGDLLIQESVAAEGQKYLINQDVIGKRFYAPIYENVSGIDSLDVEVYLYTSPLDPSTIPDSDWKPKDTVGRLQIATFGVERVLPIDVTT